MSKIIVFKGQRFRQVTTILYQMRIDNTWKYDIKHNRHGWYIAAGADCPSERDYHRKREDAFAQLINWCNLDMPAASRRNIEEGATNG